MSKFNLPCPHNDDKECEYCKGITAQDGWRFRGCFFPPNKGKHVANIKECPYEQLIQYDSVKSGIQAHAETYSFNIESKLFNQLTKEQQELWRKEIEQAVISGGEIGVELARDMRYKENLEVKDGVDSNNPTSPNSLKISRSGNSHIGENGDLEKAAAGYAREQLRNPDYPTYNDEYEIECAFEAGAQWQKQQLIDKACSWLEESLPKYWSQINANNTESFIENFRQAMEE